MSDFWYSIEEDLEETRKCLKETEQELQIKDNEIKQLQEDIVNHIKIASEYKEQMIIKDNIINAIKEELSDDNKFELFYADDNVSSVMTLGAKYYREYILDKIKELEESK